MPQSFRELPLSPISLQLERSLRNSPGAYGFCGVVTCDIEVFDQFTKKCRACRARPPSLVAYVARCLGVTLAPRTELLASRMGKKIFIPSQVDALVAVEVSTPGGAKTHHSIRVHDLGNRSLCELADEMKTRLRHAKRTPLAPPTLIRSCAPAWSPMWWRKFVDAIRSRHPRVRRALATQSARVHLSSTSQWMEGRIGWGVRLYCSPAPSVTIAGISRRAVVVENEIVAHLCLDIAVSFDHILVDGAPATRFIAALQEELESGRTLSEYPIVPREKANLF